MPKIVQDSECSFCGAEDGCFSNDDETVLICGPCAFMAVGSLSGFDQDVDTDADADEEEEEGEEA